MFAVTAQEYLVEYSQQKREERVGGWLSLLLEKILRLTLQNIVIEREEAVRKANEKLWTALLKVTVCSTSSNTMLLGNLISYIT